MVNQYERNSYLSLNTIAEQNIENIIKAKEQKLETSKKLNERIEEAQEKAEREILSYPEERRTFELKERIFKKVNMLKNRKNEIYKELNNSSADEQRIKYYKKDINKNIIKNKIASSYKAALKEKASLKDIDTSKLKLYNALIEQKISKKNISTLISLVA